MNLERLHGVIQDAMGWSDEHLHGFDVRGEAYGPHGGSDKSERQHTLERLAREGDTFTYLYDFGDSWRHKILVEKVSADEIVAPRCIDGARGCPPEDSGGVGGYRELLAAPRRPDAPRP